MINTSPTEYIVFSLLANTLCCLLSLYISNFMAIVFTNLQIYILKYKNHN